MPDSSRRNFLLAGLACPPPHRPPARPRTTKAALRRPRFRRLPRGLRYRTLGKTGLKVTAVGFGCMITSDASVIERAADIGITYFDTARVYQSGNNERMVGAALKGQAPEHHALQQDGAPRPKKPRWPTWIPACANSAPITWTSGTCTPRPSRPR